MSAETTLVSALTGDAAVSARVGTRIYPDVIPQEQAVPAIAYSRAETEGFFTIHSATPIAERVVFEVFCLDDERAVAESLADEASAALAGARFIARNRRFEFDPDNGLYATVLTVEITS